MKYHPEESDRDFGQNTGLSDADKKVWLDVCVTLVVVVAYVALLVWWAVS